MGVKRRLPIQLLRSLNTRRQRLEEFYDAQVEAFEKAPRRWQESDRGQSVKQWLEELGVIIVVMDGIPGEPR